MKCDICGSDIRDQEVGMILLDGVWELQAQPGGELDVEHSADGQELDICHRCTKMVKAVVGSMVIWHKTN